MTTSTYTKTHALIAVVFAMFLSAPLVFIGMVAAVALLGGQLDDYNAYGALFCLLAVVPLYLVAGKPMVLDRAQQARYASVHRG